MSVIWLDVRYLLERESRVLLRFHLSLTLRFFCSEQFVHQLTKLLLEPVSFSHLNPLKTSPKLTKMPPKWTVYVYVLYKRADNNWLANIFRKLTSWYLLRNFPSWKPCRIDGDGFLCTFYLWHSFACFEFHTRTNSSEPSRSIRYSLCQFHVAPRNPAIEF